MCEVAEKIYEQGFNQGAMGKAREIALNLHKDGLAEDLIAEYVDVSVEQVNEWLGLSIA